VDAREAAAEHLPRLGRIELRGMTRIQGRREAEVAVAEQRFPPITSGAATASSAAASSAVNWCSSAICASLQRCGR